MATTESGSGGTAYSRKQKSLGLLCLNFLSLYDHEDVRFIGLDDAAMRLGVERRRIYDIVNVLESVGMLTRKAKNQYSWKGFKAIPEALEELKEEGFKESFGGSQGSGQIKASDDEEDQSQLDKASASSKSADNRREKSLGLLTQNFVKLFVCSKVGMITLEDAAKVLLGEGHSPTVMRTKIRRLYDITNVLASVNIIEKITHTEIRKPAFRWVGVGGKRENKSGNVPPAGTKSTNIDFKKRAFGTDITNNDFKKRKVDASQGYKLVKPEAPQEQLKSDSLDYESDKSMGQNSKETAKGYQFGPFAPSRAPKAALEVNTKQIFNFESLAPTYRPQYQNQALKELFGHYVEAWNSWHAEIAGNPMK